MNNDDLKAWLLLAGFRYHPLTDKYVHVNRYADYTVVQFIAAGRIEVGYLTGRRRFLFSERAQQYIRKLIGDQHADISSVSRF